MAPRKKDCSPEERVRLDELARKRRLCRIANPVATKAVQDKARKKFYSLHKDRVLNWNKDYRAANYSAHLKRTSKERKARRLNNKSYLIKERVRGRLSSALKRKKAGKPTDTLNLLGCSIDKMMAHVKLEDGEVIDHIFPFELYNLHKNEQLFNVMNWENLQALTDSENREKGTRLPTKAMADKVSQDLWPPGITYDMLPDIYDGWTTPLRQ